MAGYKVLMLILTLALALAACAPAEPAVLPTLAPTATPVIVTALPTATTVARPTLPPTWTPVGETAPAGEATVPTPTVESAPPIQSVPATLPPACAVFGEDRERNSRTFVPGTAPQVFWTAIEDAVMYHIALINEAGETVFEDYTAEPTVTFAAELFEPGKLYGWEAYPINAIGNQMCYARGAELFPEGLPGRQ